MKITIAIDYDGTIADTNIEKSKWIKANIGKDIPRWQCDHTNCEPLIGKDAYIAMGNVVYERESSLASREVPGALRALRELAARGNIYVVSARPPERLAFGEEWLRANGVISLLTDLLSSHDRTKGQVCQSIAADVLIDDDVRHLQAASAPHLRRVLLQHGCPDTPNLGQDIEFCREWEDVIRLLGSA